MKKSLLLILAVVVSTLAGCVVVPARPAYYPGPAYYTPHYYYPAPHYYYRGY